jgi:hypothetical protein
LPLSGEIIAPRIVPQLEDENSGWLEATLEISGNAGNRISEKGKPNV